MSKKILIVDDDNDILEPLSIILEEEGYLVQTTPKGEKTYKKVADFKPDIILLDMLMSGSDGRTICRRLKGDIQSKKIPIVMMSAHPGAYNDAKKCMADDFIAKPFETEELLTLLQRYTA